MERNYQVVVHGLRGGKKVVNLCRTAEQFMNMTVRQLKEKIREEFPETSEENLRLIFMDKYLDGDDTLLCNYGIQHMSVIHVIIRPAGGGGGPIHENSGMGDKTGKNRSMESLRLSF